MENVFQPNLRPVLMTRTFVVGLDGASWRLLGPWLDAGELPNLAALRSGGRWAEHRSCLPPVTFPNWKCYSSGKDPGGFGVFWFERVDLANERIENASSRDFHTAELWGYLNDAGLSTGVVNMPTMYPPRELDGCLVCGGPGTAEGEYRSISSGYTHPADLAAELEERFDYRVHPDPLISSNDERGAEVEAILSVLEKSSSTSVRASTSTTASAAARSRPAPTAGRQRTPHTASSSPTVRTSPLRERSDRSASSISRRRCSPAVVSIFRPICTATYCRYLRRLPRGAPATR